MRPTIFLFAVLAIANIVVTLAAPVPKIHRLESRSTATMTAHDQTTAADVPDASLKVVQGGEDQLYARTVLPEIVKDLEQSTHVSVDPAPGMTGGTSSSSLSSSDQVLGKRDALKRWSRRLREAPLSPSDADARTLPVPSSRRRNGRAARRQRFKPPRSLSHLKINLGATRAWLAEARLKKNPPQRSNRFADPEKTPIPPTPAPPGFWDDLTKKSYYIEWNRRLDSDGEILNHTSVAHDIPPFGPAIEHPDRWPEVKAEIVDPGTSQHRSEPLQRQADVRMHDHGAEEPEVEHPVGPLKQSSRPSVQLRGALQAYQDPRLTARLPPARPPSTPLRVVEEDAIPKPISPMVSTDHKRKLELGESSTKKKMRPRVDPMRDNSGSYGRIHAVPETQASTIAGPFVQKYAPRER